MDAVVNGVPLLVVILGVVEFLKKLGVNGKASLAASMGLGLALGIVYQVSLALPVDLAGWLGAVVYGIGIALGLAASGLYDFSKQFRNGGQ